MNLVIVESPTKANTIKRFLGTDYIVQSSFGHIHDLPEKEFGVDIENDFKRGAKTLALHMGVRVSEGKLHTSPAYKALAYGIQLVDLSIVFLPFFIVWNVRRLSLFQYFQWVTLFLLGVLMFLLTYKLLTMEGFDRMRARKYIGSHYLVNFSLVPIMLMTLENPWPCLLIIFPVLGFVFSNIVLHGTLLQPKTM